MAAASDRVIVRELKCFMCGYTLGEVVSHGLQRTFKPAATCPPLGERRIARLRCPRCAGPVYLEGAESGTQWAAPSTRLSSTSRRN